MKKCKIRVLEKNMFSIMYIESEKVFVGLILQLEVIKSFDYKK